MQPTPNEEPKPLRVSALVISFNQAPQLRRCLAALEASKDRDTMEILVVDSGSLDESPRMDNEFPNVTILRLPRNFGRTKAINIGTRTAQGESLFLLEPRIEVAPDTVSRLTARLEGDNSVTAVCPLIGDGSSQVRPLPRKEDLSPSPVNIDNAAEEVSVDYPSIGAFLVRRQFVKGMNYLDEHYGDSWSDADLCLKIRGSGKKILVLPSVRVNDQGGELSFSPAARGVLLADFHHGAAVYLAKRYGFISGLLYRIKAALRELGRILSFSDTSLHWNAFVMLVSGAKIDGSQAHI